MRRKIARHRLCGVGGDRHVGHRNPVGRREAQAGFQHEVGDGGRPGKQELIPRSLDRELRWRLTQKVNLHRRAVG